MPRLSYLLPLLFILLLFSACSDDNNPTNQQGDPVDLGLLINEFLAKNDSLNVDEYGQYEDWIELYNGGNDTINIAGYTITDDLSKPDKWRIKNTAPHLTKIRPGGYLLLWADEDTLQGVLHVNLKLSENGEAIGLFTPGGSLVDFVQFGHQYPNVSMGRYPNGGSTWAYQASATPLASNGIPVANLDPVILGIERRPVVPREGQAVVIELEAFDDKGIYSAILHYQIDGGEFVDMAMTPVSTYWRAILPGQPRGTEVSYYGRVRDAEGVTVTDPHFAPGSRYSYIVPDTDYAPPIHINEFLASNRSTNRDEAGDYDDWIELYNSGLEVIDVAGMYLSDSPSDPFKYQFPLGSPALTTIPSGGFLLVWADDEPEEGDLHATFRLSASGETILLHASDLYQNILIDSYTFPSQQDDVSMGRIPDGSSNWGFMTTPTPGLSNTP